MSRTAVIIALLIAGLLALGVVLALRPAAPGAGSTGPLMTSFNINGVTSLEIGVPGGPPTVIAAEPRAPGAWVMRWTDAAGGPRSWPASASRVRGALRLLGDLRRDPAAAGGATGDETTVILRDAAGASRTLSLSQSPVAGKVRVRDVSDPSPAGALADAGLLEIFRGGNLDAWREPAMFGTEISDASRLTLTLPERGITVFRVGRSWGMQSPMVAPADEPMVTTVLNSLASISVKSFAGRSGTEGERAFDALTSSVVIESARRSGEGDAERWSLVQSVTIGGPADVGGTIVFARLEAFVQDARSTTPAPLWGPIIVTIDRGAINGVPTDPAAYLARIALRSPSPDIAGLTMTPAATTAAPWTAERTAGGWRVDAREASTKAIALLESLLKLLTQERAGTVQLHEPADYVVGLRLAVLSAEKRPLEECSLAVPAASTTDHKNAICIGSGGIWRVYSGPLAGAIAAWVRDGAAPAP